MGGKGEKIVALVTGGYKNLGLFITKGLMEAGYRVVTTYRNRGREAEAVSKEFGFDIYEADVSNKGDVLELFARIESNIGTVAVVVNNVSSFPTGPLKSLSIEEFEGAFKSSVFASNLVMKRAIPGMLEKGAGRVVNIGMAGTDQIKGYIDVAAHAAAKTALTVLTRSWARELRNDKISVNMVSPGIIDYSWRDDIWREKMKKISPSGELTQPTEVASAVCYLIDRGDVTGRVVEVDPAFHRSSV
jgi:NAD(P)-dependent dehydrogenase (short-subunit alcohol dehydrogenase family)